MACRLLGSKPLSEPLLDYCILLSTEALSLLRTNFNEILMEFQTYSFKKMHCIWKSHLQSVRHFVSATARYHAHLYISDGYQHDEHY